MMHHTHLASALRLLPFRKCGNPRENMVLSQHLFPLGLSQQDEFLAVNVHSPEKVAAHESQSWRTDSLALPHSMETSDRTDYSPFTWVSGPPRESHMPHCVLWEAKGGWPAVSSLQQFPFAVIKAALSSVETDCKHCKKGWIFPIK